MHPADSGRRMLLRSAGGVSVALLALVAGCGFRLRQPSVLSFRSISLQGFAQRSVLADELRARLTEQVLVVDTPDRADVVLQALTDARERSVVATTAAAQVRELTLRLRFDFTVRRGDGRLLLPRVDLLLARDLNYTESQALAKGFEEADLYREMQSDAVLQVMARLAALNV